MTIHDTITHAAAHPYLDPTAALTLVASIYINGIVLILAGTALTTYLHKSSDVARHAARLQALDRGLRRGGSLSIMENHDVKEHPMAFTEGDQVQYRRQEIYTVDVKLTAEDADRLTRAEAAGRLSEEAVELFHELPADVTEGDLDDTDVEWLGVGTSPTGVW